MIFESLGLFGLLTPSVTRHSSSFMICDSLGALRLQNPSVTRDSIFLMIFVSLWAVWAVEVNYHPRQQFVDDL